MCVCVVKPVLLTLHFPPPRTDVIMLSRPAKFNSATRASISLLSSLAYAATDLYMSRAAPTQPVACLAMNDATIIAVTKSRSRIRTQRSVRANGHHHTSRPPTSHPPYLRHANGEYWQPCAKRTRYRHSHAESCLHANHVRDRHRLIVLQCKPRRTCEM